MSLQAGLEPVPLPLEEVAKTGDVEYYLRASKAREAFRQRLIDSWPSRHSYGFPLDSPKQIADKREERKKAMVAETSEADEFIAALRPRTPELDVALSDVRWHSMVVSCTIHDGDRRIKADQLADTGAALTIQRMQALLKTVESKGLQPANVNLVQASGEPLNLAGKTQARLGFDARDTKGNIIGEVVYDHPAQVSSAEGLMGLIGCDFWGRHRAVMNFAQGTAEIDAPPGVHTHDGRVVIQVRTTRTPVEEELLKADPHHHIAALAPHWCSQAKAIVTVARLQHDVVLEPHTAVQTAVPMWVDTPLKDLRAGMVFQAEPLITCEHVDLGSGSNSEPKAREGLTSMPDMLTSPTWQDGQPRATVHLAVANPGSERLVLRAGSAYATLEEIRKDPEESKANDVEACVGDDLHRIALVVDPAARIDNLDPSDPLHNKSAEEIVQMVEGGAKFGDQTFEEWTTANKADLNFGPNCTSLKRHRMTTVLYAMAACLAGGADSAKMKPGTIKGTEHCIELVNPETEPTKTKIRGHPPEHVKAINEEVEKMLSQDIIEPSNSPWAAPVVLVKKKDGRWRFCVDYRMTINPVCRKDAMPLPKISDLLEQMSEAKEMSVMDILSGYWSCVVRQCDRKYLAFNTASHGLMTFKRMPFGMATSGATMQRAMERVLARDPQGQILGEFASVYIDDISVYSEEEGDHHLNDVLRVLKQLKANGIILKLKKCTWVTDIATIMGFVVKCQEGIAADTGKVEDLCAIKSLPTVASLKSFLGSCVYLSRYIKDFATLTAPLYELERLYKCPSTPLKDKWKPEHQRAFEGVKAALVSTPVLAFPNFEKPFILLTDCSDVQKGGVLLQIDDSGVERPVAYASCRLNRAEKNYSIQAKEANAGIFCIRKWRKFLLGSPTVWITDHSSLTSLRTKQDLPTSQMARFAMELMEYDLDIVHRPGRHCHMADLLTRAELEDDPAIRKHMVTETLEPKARQAIAARLEQMRQSPAERALGGDTEAYSEKEIQKHIQYLVLGANTATEDPDTHQITQFGLPTLRAKVQEITAAMERGDHVPKLGTELYPELAEEDPRMIEAYDLVCPAIKSKERSDKVPDSQSETVKETASEVQATSPTTLREEAPAQRCEHCGHTWVCKLEPPQTHRLCKTCSRKGIILPDPEELARQRSERWHCAAVHGSNVLTLEGFRLAQGEDKEVRETRDQIQVIKMQPAWNLTEREFMDKFTIEDDLLRRREWIKDVNGAHVEHFTIVVPEALRERVLHEIHEGQQGEHQGFITTYQRLKARFSWKGMYRDCREYTRNCPKCQHFGSAPAASGYGDHLRADRPGQKWVADLLYLENDGTYEIAVTLVDVFSRWCVIRPIPDATSETVAGAIMQMWAEAGVHFVPEEIVHDNGSEFKKMFEKVCELLDIKQSWSVAGRPASHGVIEKFNQDVCRMLGKKVDDRPLGNLKPHEKRWSWAIPAVEMAINSSPSRANSIGLRGYCPSEIFHGQLPRAVIDRALQPKAGMVSMNEAGMEDHIEAIRSSQKRAIEFTQQARVRYEEELDHDRRYAHKILRTFQPGDLVLRRARVDTSVARKTNPTYEEKPYIVVKTGHRGNYLLQPQRDVEAECIWVHVDQIKAYVSDQNEREEALQQAEEALELERSEFAIEAIVGHRGSLKHNTREVLVKWVGYELDTSDWRDPDTLQNKEVVRQYFSRGNPNQRVYDLAASASDRSDRLIYEAMTPHSGFIQADILDQDPDTLVGDICRSARVKPEEVVLVWASPPCQTFTNSAYNVGRGSGHGYNYRDFADPERGPCCQDLGCPYRKMAELHDRCVPHLQKMVQADWDRGIGYDYVVENPHGCLGLRPYTQTRHWPDQRVNKFTVDQCAFGKLTQKPTDLWTSLPQFRPVGSTGDGRCHERCGRGYFTDRGTYRHVQAYAQEPSRQPRGSDRVSIPPLLLEEVLGSAFDGSKSKRRVVIDLYCGYRSVAPIAEALGMHYIGVDIVKYQNDKAQAAQAA